MAPSAEDVRKVLQQLRATPKHFATVSKGLEEAQLAAPPAAGEWSVNELLAHLRGAADVQGSWIARMLAEDTPTIRAVSPRTGMKKGGYATLPFADSLRGFTRDRAALVKTLTALDDWARSATFTGTTRGSTPTVFDMARGIAAHEHSHFDQIAAAARA